MANDLRWYLLIKPQRGAVTVEVLRSFEALWYLWIEQYEGDSTLTGLIFAGEKRPPSDEVRSLLLGWGGLTVVAESARWLLPAGFTIIDRAVDAISASDVYPEMLVYLGLDGWGYDPNFAREAHFKVLGISPSAEAASPTPTTPTSQSDDVPIEILAGEDPFQIIRHLPDWAKAAPLTTMPLSVRCRNVFLDQGFTTVGELSPYSTDQARQWKNFGRQSVKDLVDSLRAFLSLGPGRLAPAEEIPNALQLPPLLACFERVLLSIPLREAEVLRKRWAHDGVRRTLEEVGAAIGVTRERVRQIEAKSARKLSQEHPWLASLGPRVLSLLSQREDPLYIDLLEIEDQWFAGAAMQVALFENLLTIFGDEGCHVIQVNQRRIVCRMTQDEWDSAQKDILKRLSQRVEDGLTAQNVAVIVEASLPSGSELTNLMIERIDDSLRYLTADDGTKQLSSVGRRVTAVIEEVLNESAVPLHYSIVSERVQAALDRPLQARYIHATLHSMDALYFDRGTYGTWRHMPLSIEEQSAMLRFLDDWIDANENVDRQWHAQEFLELVLAQWRFARLKLDKYVIDILLRKATGVVPVGRMVWVSKSRLVARGAERIDVSEACVRILMDNGGPMDTPDIRRILQENRGLGLHFQINPSRYVARVARGCWGLVERDFGVTPALYTDFVNGAFDHISSRGELIDTAELIHALQSNHLVPQALTLFAAVNLLQTDERLHIFRGNMAGLSEWATSEEVANDALSDLSEIKPSEAENMMLDFENM